MVLRLIIRSQCLSSRKVLEKRKEAFDDLTNNGPFLLLKKIDYVSQKKNYKKLTTIK